MKIDLHGLNSEEATREIFAGLFSLEMSDFDDYLEIVTGKGEGILLTTTLNILDKENVNYYLSEGKVIVKKTTKEGNDDKSWIDLILEEKNNLEE